MLSIRVRMWERAAGSSSSSSRAACLPLEEQTRRKLETLGGSLLAPSSLVVRSRQRRKQRGACANAPRDRVALDRTAHIKPRQTCPSPPGAEANNTKRRKKRKQRRASSAETLACSMRSLGCRCNPDIVIMGLLVHDTPTVVILCC